MECLGPPTKPPNGMVTSLGPRVSQAPLPYLKSWSTIAVCCKGCAMTNPCPSESMMFYTRSSQVILCQCLMTTSLGNAGAFDPEPILRCEAGLHPHPQPHPVKAVFVRVESYRNPARLHAPLLNRFGTGFECMPWVRPWILSISTISMMRSRGASQFLWLPQGMFGRQAQTTWAITASGDNRFRR